MAETQYIINLSDEEMFFYEKNIIHDIIHDYGFYSAVTRWVKNINNLRSFTNQGFTIFVNDGNIDDGDSDDDAGETEGGGLTCSREAPPTPQRSSSSHVQNLEGVINAESLSKKIKLTRRINTEFVNALKNFFVFNLFESLLKVIKRVRHDSPINNNIKDEIIHDIFFSNLDFFYYYDDNEINIDDMIDIFGNDTIIDDNNNPKKFDFVIFLTNLLNEFESQNKSALNTINDSSSSSPRNSPKRKVENSNSIQSFIPNIFEKLNLFLDDNVSDNVSRSNLTTTDSEQLPRVINGSRFTIGYIDYNIYQMLKPSNNSMLLDDNDGDDNDGDNNNNNNSSQRIKKNKTVVGSTLKMGEAQYDDNNNNNNMLVEEDKNGGTLIINTMKGGENEKITKINTFLNFYESELSNFEEVFTGDLRKIIQVHCHTPDRENFIKETIKLMNDVSLRFLTVFNNINEFFEEKFKTKFETNFKKIQISFYPRVNGSFLFNLNTRQIRDDFCSNQTEIVENITKKYIKDLHDELAPCLKIIEDQKKKYELEDKKENLAHLKRDAENTSGGLGDKKIVQENFLTAVAKLGLFLNDGFNFESIDNSVKTLCELESNILKYYADGCPRGNTSYRDLDTILYKVFKTLSDDVLKTQNFTSETYMCNKGKFYMIDNAAALNTKRRKNCVFCPLTSVCDGMGQCTLGSQGEYKADNNNIERGDMLFSVQNNNNNTSYYKGKLELNGEESSAQTLPTTAKYTIKYKGFRDNFPPSPGKPPVAIAIETELDINIGSSKIKDLEAHNVLKNTLVAILNFIVAQYTGNSPNEIAEYLTSGNDVFSNIVNIIREDEIKFNTTLHADGEKIIHPNEPNNMPLNHELLNTFFKILGKGAGDIFQEINAICKYGGYSGKNYYKPTGIINWNNDGNAIRFFAANDRPSACRFIFLTWFGNDRQINMKSLGGYIPENDKNRLIVIKQNTEGFDLCRAVASHNALATGGGKANTKKRKESRKQSRKRNIKTKKHKKVKQLKRSKKYSQSKKHRKTNKRK